MVTQRARLNRPQRGIVASGELVLAVIAVVIAVFVWRSATVQLSFPTGDGRNLTSTRLLGDRAGIALVLVLVAGVALLDAARQAVLASKAGRRRKEDQELERYQRMEADERSVYRFEG